MGKGVFCFSWILDSSFIVGILEISFVWRRGIGSFGNVGRWYFGVCFCGGIVVVLCWGI